jgi:hypothetical protein
MPIERFSSRRQALGRVLSDRLNGATRYLRIAGYFRSSLLEVVGEALDTVGEIRVVCNGDLDPYDVKVAKAARDGQEALARTLVSSWQSTEDGLDLLLARERYRRLHDLLSAGRMKVRVVPRDGDNVFVHGKAGVIEHASGKVYSFVGSMNDSVSGLRHAYEILWGDEDPAAAAWVRDEFEHFWTQGVDLPDAVVKHVAAMASRIEYRSIEEARDSFGEIAAEAVPRAIFSVVSMGPFFRKMKSATRGRRPTTHSPIRRKSSICAKLSETWRLSSAGRMSTPKCRSSCTTYASDIGLS